MHKPTLMKKSFVTTAIALLAMCSGAWRAEADGYVQTNLVSDIAGLALVTDTDLQNPWGVARSPTSPFWSSNQGTNTATLYAVTDSTNVSKVATLTVTIPTTASGPQGPTGMVNNTNASLFLINGDSSASAHFIFANLNGTISAWSSFTSNGTTAVVQATTAGASYTGLAINQAQTQLYAANNAAGTIDVFGSNFKPVTLATGAFATPRAFGSLVPFNVQDLNGNVYVTYAPAGHPAQTMATGPGAGAVAIFDENGTLKQTLVDGHLAAPWGIAIAPSNFGQFSNDLLVGNFSYVNSFISAFASDSTGHLTFQGTIPIDVGNGNTAGGLWSLIFGNAGMNGSPDTLYFSDGIDGEMKGLIGAINAVPLPAALPLFATGLGALGLLGWRRKKKAIAA